MARGFVIVVLAALVIGPALGEAAPASANADATAVTGTQNVRVTPTVGGPKATFTFSFTTPITTRVGVESTIYETVQGATTNLATINKGGCLSTFDIAVPYAATGGASAPRLGRVRTGAPGHTALRWWS
jgi:hypothetical protein